MTRRNRVAGAVDRFLDWTGLLRGGTSRSGRGGGPHSDRVTWSIVSTMRGTAQEIAPFVAHHLQTDALVLHIYLDEANPEVEAMLAPLAPRVRLTVCTAAYWQATRYRERPASIIRRQIHNGDHARRKTRADWLVHIDSDEFLQQETGDAHPSLSTELSAVPRGIDWARIRHRERVFLRGTERLSVFDGMFRSRITDPAILTECYGADSSFLVEGFSGYTRGKTAIRVKSPVHMRLHVGAYKGQGGESPEHTLPPFMVLQGTSLLHFDGWTPLQWTAKLLRRVETNRIDSGHRGRRRQLHFMHDNKDLKKRLGLFERIQTLPADKADWLAGQGLLHRTPFDPCPALAAVFPGHHFAFGINAYDGILRQSDPDFFRRYDLLEVPSKVGAAV